MNLQKPTIGAAVPALWPQGRTATVSLALVQDWLDSLRAQCPTAVLDQCLRQAGIATAFMGHPGYRLTHDQIVRLYQESAAATGDEMMGLWSRPIRTGSLKYIVRSVMGAPSIRVALYRFTQFWNLLLDDYRLELRSSPEHLGLALVPRSPAVAVQRFGHALLLKLTHGIVSWLLGREVPVQQVAFAFARPAFAPDYAVLFPAPVVFGAQHSCIRFAAELGAQRGQRQATEVRAFLERAPRDWIFTAYHEHALGLKVRELLHADLGRSLDDVAQRLHLSPRTLMRRLQDEQLSFQSIKDALRRDLALLHLAHGALPLAALADALGFSSPAVFHRAFRHWTGMTPGQVRRAAPEPASAT
ncbi:MAG: AraC family transcriptional regulator ligand-binding domain-containing protein [Rhodoferax sp.]